MLLSNSKEALKRASERQVDTHASNGLVMTVLQLRHAVVAKARRTAPDGNIAVPQSELPHWVIALQAAELQRRRQTQRHGDDRISEIALVLVLMKGQERARLIAID